MIVEAPMKACPSFSGCNAPVCPLERCYPNTRLRFRLPGETKCKARQSIRLKLGQSLKYRGLLMPEHNGYASLVTQQQIDNNPESEIVESHNSAQFIGLIQHG